ncbi:MAG: hypothetical protein R2789_13300 [Microthrixaceae bacterium]
MSLSLRNDPVVLAAMAVSMAVIYALRIAGLYSNWPFAVLLAAAGALAYLASGPPLRATSVEEGSAAESDRSDGSLRSRKWVGITEPWTPAQLARIEQALDLDSIKAEFVKADLDA